VPILGPMRGVLFRNDAVFCRGAHPRPISPYSCRSHFLRALQRHSIAYDPLPGYPTDGELSLIRACLRSPPRGKVAIECVHDLRHHCLPALRCIGGDDGLPATYQHVHVDRGRDSRCAL